jgi:protein-disulfide isomerase
MEDEKSMKLTGESKIFLGIIAITVVIIGLASIVLTKPAPTFTNSDLVPTGVHTKGNSNAKTVLVEFSDFQCPACLAVKPVVDAILAKHKDNIVFAYRHFPLDQHPFSRTSAAAAEAAGMQGKFWEMYDVLFENQANFSDEFFSTKLFQLVQLDKSKFDSDLKSKTVTGKVSSDLIAGTGFGVNSTPSFFLNGKKLELTSFDDLSKAVDDAVLNAK